MRIAIAACFLLACAHNVPQDKATSTDGRVKGAKKLELDNGAVEERGIVTYPGGDRVDWKKVELPEKQRGALDIELSWVTPRPGLKLGFDVFDGYNQQLVSGKRITKAMRRASIKDAHGTYFIRVYAVGRGDAGKYKLGIDFDGREVGPAKPIEVSDPPKLADLPVVTATEKCDLVKFDFSNEDCQNKCPLINPPASWPGCSKTCTVSPPNADIPACAATMACPPGGDIRVKSCTKRDFRACPDPKNPDPTNLNCLNFQYEPEVARIVKKQVIGNEVEVIIMIGAKSNVTSTWTGAVLQGTTSKPLAGGKLTITNVDTAAGTLTGRLRLTAQQVEANLNVVFAPPPKQKP
jgi:hypothetical protein